MYENYSAFGGALFIIPFILLLLPALYCTYRVFKVRKGGTYYWEGGVKYESKTKPKFTSIASFWFALFLWAAFFTTIIVMYADK